MKRFYFQIPSINVVDCVWAASFVDAKAQAAQDWLPYWHDLQWLDTDLIHNCLLSLSAREAAVAEAMEQQVPVAVDTAVKAALDKQRQWFIELIDEQLDQLRGAGTHAALLLTLRERISDD